MMHQSNENKMTEEKISILHQKDINATAKYHLKRGHCCKVAVAIVRMGDKKKQELKSKHCSVFSVSLIG
jgi:hypothetical protein